MNAVAYPWRWLADAIGTSFALRYPWVDAIKNAASSAEAVCLLLPTAVGPVFSWATWLADLLERNDSPRCLVTGGDFESVKRTLVESYQVEEELTAGRPADWSRRFIIECRQQMPHVEAVPILVVEANDNCAESLQDV